MQLPGLSGGFTPRLLTFRPPAWNAKRRQVCGFKSLRRPTEFSDGAISLIVTRL